MIDTCGDPPSKLKQWKRTRITLPPPMATPTSTRRAALIAARGSIGVAENTWSEATLPGTLSWRSPALAPLDTDSTPYLSEFERRPPVNASR